MRHWREELQARLAVKRNGIVQAGFDPPCVQILTQTVALWRTDHEQVPYVVLMPNDGHVEREPR
jgi:hypothetical protein